MTVWIKATCAGDDPHTDWDCSLDLSFGHLKREGTSAACAVSVRALFDEPPAPAPGSAESALRAIAGRKSIKALCQCELRIGYGVHCPPEIQDAAKRSPSTRDDALDEFCWTITSAEFERFVDAMLVALGADAMAIFDLEDGAHIRGALHTLLRSTLKVATTEDLGLAEQAYLEDVLSERLGPDAADDVLNALVRMIPSGGWGCETGRAWLEQVGRMFDDQAILIGDLTVHGTFPYVGDDYGTPEDLEVEYGVDALDRHMVRWADASFEDHVAGPYMNPHEARLRAKSIAEESHIGEHGEDAAAYAKRIREEEEDEDEGSDWR
jgi:hypothetical protein